jgi:hypothetical protein
MALVDDRGRLFGRVNLLDAIVGVVLIALVPLAYGAYSLFRTPAPKLTSVTPNSLVAGPNLRVVIKGEHLRPYMRVSFNTVQGNSFIFRSTSEAVIDLNEMAPGEYDVVLFDYSQERARLPKALTITPSPLPDSQVTVIGSFGNLTAERAAAIKTGLTIAGVGEVVQVGQPLPEITRVFAGPVLEIPVDKAVRLPAALRVACHVRAPQGVPQCAVGDVVLQPTALLFVKSELGTVPFQIDQIRGHQPLQPIRITVQFAGRPVVLSQMRRGDVDYGAFVNELAAGATVAERSSPLTVGQDMVRIDVTLHAQGQTGGSSWLYASSPIRVGSPLTFRTPRYELSGTIVKIEPEWSNAAAVAPTR